ncbi:MAG TPA: acetamidase/formamidase family protein [Acidobacteriaceae bacterium]|jgi:acetamidase/formamidase|nr:acetamidase/formamidase family protein [Acidobacteriaceae bacterium]
MQPPRARVLLFVTSQLIGLPLFAQQTLAATPATVAWGYYSARAKPALTVHSGDIVRVETLSTCGSPERLEEMGVPTAEIPASVRTLYAAQGIEKGPGGHILTGPIAIAEAEPGDVLEVRIQKIDIDVPWSCNGFAAGKGYLPDDFPYDGSKIIPLDREHGYAQFAPGIRIPLRPFFGSMGVAPPRSAGRYNSTAPWMHGGNMDNKELVAGSVLYLPVHAAGALFEVGDGHAGQGNGEVDITAMETMLSGTFQFIVHKDQHLLWPQAETPSAWITMGFDEDLNAATTMAIRNMIDFLVNEKHLSRDEAYQLSSVAVDLDITQLVDGKVGVHAMLPKALFQ